MTPRAPTLAQLLLVPGTQAQHERLPYRVSVDEHGLPHFSVGMPVIGLDGDPVIVRSPQPTLALSWKSLPGGQTRVLPQSGWISGFNDGPLVDPAPVPSFRKGFGLDPAVLWSFYFLDGLGFVEIAQRCGVGVATIYHRWGAWKFPRRAPGALIHGRGGLTDSQIAMVVRERAKPPKERPTLAALGKKLGVSRERVRQIEAGARRTTAKERKRQ